MTHDELLDILPTPTGHGVPAWDRRGLALYWGAIDSAGVVGLVLSCGEVTVCVGDRLVLRSTAPGLWLGDVVRDLIGGV